MCQTIVQESPRRGVRICTLILLIPEAEESGLRSISRNPNAASLRVSAFPPARSPLNEFESCTVIQKLSRGEGVHRRQNGMKSSAENSL